MQHSLTPWKFGRGGTIEDANGRVVANTRAHSSNVEPDCDAQNEENRRAIIAAMNNHARCVAALVEITRGDVWVAHPAAEELARVRAIARAALAEEAAHG